MCADSTRLGNGAAPAYDAHIMKRNHIATAASLAVSAGLMAVALAAPAQADPETDAFLTALTDSGITGVDPALAVAVGQQVCPMLSEPGQQMAEVASKVSESIGRPLGPATMFTGLAITLFCPSVVSSVANGQSPIPLDLIGLI
jgi:hypothetical protein